MKTPTKAEYLKRIHLRQEVYRSLCGQGIDKAHGVDDIGSLIETTDRCQHYLSMYADLNQKK